MKRTQQKNVRLSREEDERLQSVAKHYGLSRADLIRMLLKREHDEMQKRTERTAAVPAPPKGT